MRLIRLIVLVSVALPVAPVQAQQEQKALPQIEAANLASGIKTYRDDRWGILKSAVINTQPVEADVLLAVGSEDGRTIRFCNRVWMPPNSRRVLHTPLRMMAEEKGGNQFRIESKLIHIAKDRETVGRSHVGILLRKEGGITSALLSDEGTNAPTDLITALRKSASQGTSNTLLIPEDLPTIATGYDALDVLFVSCHEPDLGPAQMDAIRQWLMCGGRLWIMLDSTGANWPAVLLGNDWDIAVIDSVGLTDVTFETYESNTRHFDYPVTCLRVLAPSYEKILNVDGYPVALQKSVGRGQLIVTTISPEAWLNPDGSATQALQKLHAIVRPDTSNEDEQTRIVSAFDGYSRTMIAYTILGRGAVLGVLAVYTLLIAVSAIWLAHNKMLERVAALAMAFAMIASIMIVAMGINQQSSTPTSVVSAQLVRLDPDQNYAQVDSIMSIYTSPVDPGDAAQVTLKGGGTAWPALAGQGVDNIRLVWTDPDAVVFENMGMPSGAVRRIVTKQFVAVPKPLRVFMSFNENGIIGQLSNQPDAVIRDPLIVTGTGMMAPSLDSDGRIRAGLDDILPAGQFMDASLIDRNQAGRKEVYKNLLADRSPAQDPILYLWQDRSVGGASYSAHAYEHAEALVALPISFSKPQPGNRICVPAPLVKMLPFREQVESNFVPSVVYNPETGLWYKGLSEPMLVLMRFSVPNSIGPVRIESARLSFDLRAPGRAYQLAMVSENKLSLFPGESNQLGRTTIDLTGNLLPQQQADGSIIVGVYVGPFADPQVSRGWALDAMSLSVTGVVE